MSCRNPELAAKLLPARPAGRKAGDIMKAKMAYRVSNHPMTIVNPVTRTAAKVVRRKRKRAKRDELVRARKAARDG